MSAYERVLRLEHLRLSGWQREMLTWGVVVVTVLLTLAGLITAWGILVLPLLVAAVLKAHDALSGRLATAAAAFVPAHPGIPRPHGDGDGDGD